MSIEKLDFEKVVQSKKGFTTSLNDVIQNIPDAFVLGVYIYLSSLPPSWEVNRAHIMKHFNVGREKLHKALRWLHTNFLISYHQNRFSNGTVDKSTMIVHEGWEFIEKIINNQQDSSALLKTRIVDRTALLKNRTTAEPHCGKSATINKRAFTNKRKEKNKRGTVAKKRSFLPDDFMPSKENIDLADQRKLDSDIVIKKFKADAKARGKKQEDWQAALTKWILDEKPVKKIITNIANKQNESPNPIKFWEPGNPDYDRVNGI